MRKIVIAITGASGSIYARQLLSKLITLKEQWQELAVVMTENAKDVWQTELGDQSFGSFPINYPLFDGDPWPYCRRHIQ